MRLANYFGIHIHSILLHTTHVLYRKDFKQGYTGLRPALALMNPEWEDAQVYGEYLEKVGLEARDWKTCVKFYVHYAQKPAQ